MTLHQLWKRIIINKDKCERFRTLIKKGYGEIDHEHMNTHAETHTFTIMTITPYTN